ncbi:MAG: energy-coupled thiamine transporter ThiT [Oscillospiraceae bacterium]|jgi:thiamine transporter|nr:energy-coupled thiamine transporter ThiT [Oscillospiraceae bacterium]
MQSKSATRALTESAILIAAAYALSFFKAKFWAQGGSVDFVMIPILIIAFRHGPAWGIGSGLVFGTIKCFFAGGFAWGWASILLDYSVAYAAVGAAGFFRKANVNVGTVVAGLLRFAVHFVSGITIYAVTVAEPGELFGKSYGNAAVFSLLYNGSYMLVNIVICVVVMNLLARSELKRYLHG